VESFSDSVVAGEAPHGDDLLRPRRQSLPQLDQRSQAGLAQFIDGAQQARDQHLTLFTRAMFLQKQIAQTLFEAVDHFQRRTLCQIGSQLLGLSRLQIVAMPAHERQQATVPGADSRSRQQFRK